MVSYKCGTGLTGNIYTFFFQGHIELLEVTKHCCFITCHTVYMSGGLVLDIHSNFFMIMKTRVFASRHEKKNPITNVPLFVECRHERMVCCVMTGRASKL